MIPCDFAALWRDREEVCLGGAVFATLPRRHLALYLCGLKIHHGEARFRVCDREVRARLRPGELRQLTPVDAPELRVEARPPRDAVDVLRVVRARQLVQLLPRQLELVLDLTSVGVGISQVVPVIVMCLLAPPGSLVLLEQPELHLHPALQQRLGDFLLACARAGRVATPPRCREER